MTADLVYWIIGAVAVLIMLILPDKQFKVLVRILDSKNFFEKGRGFLSWIKELRRNKKLEK